MIAGPSQSKPGVPIASGGGGGVGVTWAVLVRIGLGGVGVAVKSAPAGEDVGVESGGGGVWVARSIGVATGVAHEINILANSVMTPTFTCRFIVLLLS